MRRMASGLGVMYGLPMVDAPKRAPHGRWFYTVLGRISVAPVHAQYG